MSFIHTCRPKDHISTFTKFVLSLLQSWVHLHLRSEHTGRAPAHLSATEGRATKPQQVSPIWRLKKTDPHLNARVQTPTWQEYLMYKLITAVCSGPEQPRLHLQTSFYSVKCNKVLHTTNNQISPPISWKFFSRPRFPLKTGNKKPDGKKTTEGTLQPFTGWG